jgi:hypothetical protein
MRFSSALAFALSAGAALGQVGIPAHSNVYTGFSRGFNFVAQSSFSIVQLDLPLDAYVAGFTASYLVRINGVTVLHSIGNAGPIAGSVPVQTGDVVDIIGNWSPAGANNATASNSYGSATAGAGAAPFATVIEGLPTTLNRTGWQWDIGDPSWVDTGVTGAYLASTSGQIGRVLVTTSSGGGGTLATNQPLGQGCIRQFTSFYENFATAASFDLGGQAMTMIPTGSEYTMLGGLGTFVPPSPAALALTLGDDTETSVTLSTPFAYPGGSTSQLTVCSNGFVSVATGNGTGFAPDTGTLCNSPQTAYWCWHDYNPASVGSGQVKFEEVGSIACITWDGVHSYGQTAPETFQMQFDLVSGSVTIIWQAISGLGGPHAVGYSPGGASADPGSLDISASLATSFSTQAQDILPLTLTSSSRPILGTTWSMSVSNIPANGLIGLDLLGLQDPGLNDLAFLGAPGCGLRSSADLSFFWFAAGSSTHAFAVPIPNDPSFVGIDVFASTALLTSPPSNAFGGITANGIKGSVGDF